MENLREIVLDTLLAIEKGQDFSHRLEKAVLDKYNYLDARDKRFMKRVTQGALERQIELDYYIDQYAKVPVKKMKPFIRCLLRMSVYQLLYMDGVPDSAVCNEACKLADKRKFHNLKGFVNGILRTIAKNKDRLPLPDEKNIDAYLSVKYSMPEWLVNMWIADYGKEVCTKLLEGLLKIHPLVLRFPCHLDKKLLEQTRESMMQQGVKLTQSLYSEYVYMAENADNPEELFGFTQGYFTVQDISSVLAVGAAGIQKDDFVMDVCAAPGGKSILASEMAAHVLAGDLSLEKTDRIMENAARMNCTNIDIRVHDATDFDENYKEKADVVILDVPCSGLGVIGKKRDIKYHVSKEGMDSLVQLQKKIVENSWQYVKPGGILLYSTCTIHRAENEEMVKWILDRLPFEADDIAPYLPQALLVENQRLKEACEMAEKQEWQNCCMQLLPGFMATDGFFFARLRRKAENG